MANRKIPKNTDVFTYFNENPKMRHTDDCVIRAIATATNRDWETVYRDMVEFSISIGEMVNSSVCVGKYLKHIGWTKFRQPRKVDSKKYTAKEFAKDTVNKFVVANVGGHHVSCFVDGKLYDIWDCTEKCVGNYWLKVEVKQ